MLEIVKKRSIGLIVISHEKVLLESLCDKVLHMAKLAENAPVLSCHSN